LFYICTADGIFFLVDAVCSETVSVCLQDVLREAGCLQRLSAILKSYKLALAAGHNIDHECLHAALTAINNLAMNERSQPLLVVCLSAFRLFGFFFSVCV